MGALGLAQTAASATAKVESTIESLSEQGTRTAADAHRFFQPPYSWMWRLGMEGMNMEFPDTTRTVADVPELLNLVTGYYANDPVALDAARKAIQNGKNDKFSLENLAQLFPEPPLKHAPPSAVAGAAGASASSAMASALSFVTGNEAETTKGGSDEQKVGSSAGSTSGVQQHAHYSPPQPSSQGAHATASDPGTPLGHGQASDKPMPAKTLRSGRDDGDDDLLDEDVDDEDADDEFAALDGHKKSPPTQQPRAAEEEDKHDLDSPSVRPAHESDHASPPATATSKTAGHGADKDEDDDDDKSIFDDDDDDDKRPSAPSHSSSSSPPSPPVHSTTTAPPPPKPEAGAAAGIDYMDLARTFGPLALKAANGQVDKNEVMQAAVKEGMHMFGGGGGSMGAGKPNPMAEQMMNFAAPMMAQQMGVDPNTVKMMSGPLMQLV